MNPTAVKLALIIGSGALGYVSIHMLRPDSTVYIPKGSTVQLDATRPAPWPALKVSGRYLTDPCGEQIVIRGVEDNVRSDVGEIAKSGANAIRFVYTMEATELAAKIQAAVDHKMLVSMIPGHGYMDTSWWNRPDIKAVLLKYQAWVLPHAYGEGAYSRNKARWIRETKKVISDLRGYGYKFPIEILADQWGQSLETLLDVGSELVAFDPEHNILLGNQMYSENHPDEVTMAKIVKSGLPIMVGTCTFRDPQNPAIGWYGAPLDQYQKVWRATYENHIGSFYWNWTTGGDALTKNGKNGNWTVPGEFICGKGAYSIPKVSKKTHWMLTGGCSNPVSWRSSNPSVASVSPDGVVTGVGEGAATITADSMTYSVVVR